MKLISLNVGKPKPFVYNGREIYTSIFKTPVEGQRSVSKINIEGDEQSDLTVHGGELKAVYSYDISYYERWKDLIKRDDWRYGLFGENLTTEGLTDDVILIGNVYRIGSVLLKAVQPRFPCYKLNIRFGTEDMLQRFAEHNWSGTYFSVLQEGTLQPGDSIELIETSQHQVTIKQLVEAYYSKGADKDLLQQILAIEFLPERLRRTFLSYELSY